MYAWCGRPIACQGVVVIYTEHLWTACFTGYRADKFPFPLLTPSARLHAFIRALDGAVDRAVRDGYSIFYCGGAYGFDLLAAEAVLRARESQHDVQLRCALPFPEQAGRWDARWREKYERVLAAADSVEVLAQRYAKDCYHKRNRFMVDRSSCLICYFSGLPGGTAYTVRYALEKGLQVVNLCAAQDSAREQEEFGAAPCTFL